MTIATLAATLAASFVKDKRNDGTEFVKLKADAPAWAQDAVQAAHADMMPDDWRYRMIREVALELDEVLSYNADADLDDAAHERIDSLIPVYNWDRLQWVASSLYRAAYVDEALENMGGHLSHEDGLFTLLAYGLEQEYREIWYALTKALADEVEAEEDDDPDHDEEEG